MSQSYAIQTIQLTKIFQPGIQLPWAEATDAIAAVQDVSLEIYDGEVFGFLGPNGAGKTTTIAMLLGLMQPTAGHALIQGYNVAMSPIEALRGVGAMIEGPAFYPYLSGYNNLRVLAHADGLPETNITAALEMVELSRATHQRFATYSQGMRQRLGIAAALLAEPPIIILDEPTNGLDPAGMVEIRNLIRSLAASGRTIFLSSHLLHEVEQVCQRVAILKEGRVLAQGTVDELLQRGRGVHLRIDGDTNHAIALLREMPWINDVEQQGDMLLVDARSDRAAEINALLTRHDILITEIRAHEESLEEFFLEITQESPPPAQ